jgi:hypothetical protein
MKKALRTCLIMFITITMVQCASYRPWYPVKIIITRELYHFSTKDSIGKRSTDSTKKYFQARIEMGFQTLPNESDKLYWHP